MVNVIKKLAAEFNIFTYESADERQISALKLKTLGMTCNIGLIKQQGVITVIENLLFINNSGNFSVEIKKMSFDELDIDSFLNLIVNLEETVINECSILTFKKAALSDIEIFKAESFKLSIKKLSIDSPLVKDEIIKNLDIKVENIDFSILSSVLFFLTESFNVDFLKFSRTPLNDTNACCDTAVVITDDLIDISYSIKMDKPFLSKNNSIIEYSIEARDKGVFLRLLASLSLVIQDFLEEYISGNQIFTNKDELLKLLSGFVPHTDSIKLNYSNRKLQLSVGDNSAFVEYSHDIQDTALYKYFIRKEDIE